MSTRYELNGAGLRVPTIALFASRLRREPPGLYLRITPAGVKTFSFVGLVKSSARVEQITFGKYPTIYATAPFGLVRAMHNFAGVRSPRPI